MDPVTPGTVYLGLDRGQPSLWKSASAAASWAPTASLGREAIFQIETDPTSPRTLYAATASSSLYRSRDGGGSWEKIGPGPFVLSISVGRTPDNSGSLLYAATTSDLWKSADGGSTWSPANLGPISVVALAAAPSDARVVFVVVAGFVALRSMDAGLTWQRMPEPRLANTYRLVVHPRRPSTVYAVTVVGFAPSGDVLRSDDGGLTWSPPAARPIGKTVLAFALDVIDSMVALAGTPEGLYRTEDGGASWSPFGDLGAYVLYALRVDPNDPSRLFAGTGGTGVLRSTDGGRSWSRANHGLASGLVTSFVGGGQPSERLYAILDNCGLARSDDGGRTWPCLNIGFNGSLLAVDPTDSATVYSSGADGLLKSVDGGIHFQPVQIGFPGSVSALLFDPADASKIFAVTSFGLLRSGDHGITWTRITSSPMTVLAIGSPPTTIYFSTTVCIRPRMIFCDGGIVTTFYVMTADGAISQITPLSAGPRIMAVDPSNPSTLLAGGDFIARSTDRGNSWSAVVGGPAIVHSIVFDRVRPGRVYVSGNNGVWTSADSGVSWALMNQGLERQTVVSLLLEEAGTRLHAAARDGGVFNFEIGSSAAILSPAADRQLSVTLSARDPRTGLTAQGLTSQRAGDSAYFVLPDITGDSENPEVFVKAVDGRPLNGSIWFFYGGLTDLEYTLTVTELATGRSRTYAKPAYSSCGGADTGAFPSGRDASHTLEATGARAGAEAGAVPGCAPEALCLSPGRDFVLLLTARDPRTGRVATGFPVAVLDTFGSFSLPALTGNAFNPEVFVKMLDATPIDGKYWLLYGGLTDLEYTLTVSDVATGGFRVYTKPAGSFCGGFDSAALPLP